MANRYWKAKWSYRDTTEECDDIDLYDYFDGTSVNDMTNDEAISFVEGIAMEEATSLINISAESVGVE